MVKWNISSPILQRKNDPGSQTAKKFKMGLKNTQPKTPLIPETERIIKLIKKVIE
jgi:hypothetical protein